MSSDQVKLARSLTCSTSSGHLRMDSLPPHISQGTSASYLKLLLTTISLSLYDVSLVKSQIPHTALTPDSPFFSTTSSCLSLFSSSPFSSNILTNHDTNKRSQETNFRLEFVLFFLLFFVFFSFFLTSFHLRVKLISTIKLI